MSMEYDVIIEQDETGAFIADVPILPGCHSWGDTKEEALANVKEAIELYLEVNGAPASHVIAIEKVSVGA
jgi:predicted RNase H-like HicB family nuclease